MSYRRKHIGPKIKGLRKRISFYKTKSFWFSLLATIIFGTFLYFLLFFPKVQVEAIHISGNSSVANEEIQNAAWDTVDRELITAGLFNVSSKSIFIINAKSLVKSILEKFPQIQEVTVQKEFPHNLVLKVKERTPFAVYCDLNNRCFYLDETGVIFKTADVVSEEMLMIRKDSDENFQLGEVAIEKKMVSHISTIINNLKTNFQIQIQEVTVSDILTMKTSENWRVYFDSVGDIAMQLQKLDALLKNEISPTQRKNLQYIYLQYKDKVYYK